MASCSVVVVATRHASTEVRCACTYRPGVPKVLPGSGNTVSLRGPSITGSRRLWTGGWDVRVS